ncbi:MAG TPA: hypothetical protein VF912_11835 [Anaeromyxobacter sp.]
MRRRRLPLLAAALLAALAALLLGLSDGPGPARPAAEVAFPRYVREPEARRIEERRTLPPPASAPAPRDGEAPAARPARDPFLVALPRDPKRALVVLEANALRHSRIGELFVDCVFRGDGRDPFEAIRREVGIDPLKDLDRVALSPDGVVLSGFFEHARLEGLEEESRVTRYGDSGRLFEPRAPGTAEDPEPCLGVWGDHLMVIGERPFIEATIDRLEGRAAEAAMVIPEGLTYGEAYGVVAGEGLRALFRGEQSELGVRLAEVASRIELHADAMNDVAVVARVSGEDGARLEDLGKTFGAALAVGRIQARARGDEKLTALLEHARVERRGQGFSLELALPIAVVEGWFEGCGRRAPAPGGAASPE